MARMMKLMRLCIIAAISLLVGTGIILGTGLLVGCQKKTSADLVVYGKIFTSENN